MSTRVTQVSKILTGLIPTSTVGIDIGSSAIKVSEFTGSTKKPHLKNFHFEPIPQGTFLEDELQRPEALIEALNKVFDDKDYKSKSVALGMTGSSASLHRIKVTKTKEDELEDLVPIELEQFLNYRIEDAAYSYKIIEADSEGVHDLIVACTHKEQLRMYQNIFGDIGINLKIVDLSSLAFANIFDICFYKTRPEVLEGSLLVDIGSQKMTLVIVEDGRPNYSKEIYFGGVNLTEEIQGRMNLSFDEAENIKFSGNVVPEEILPTFDNWKERCIDEIKVATSFFLNTVEGLGINHCFVTGGASYLPGFLDGLRGALDFEVDYFRPLDFISVGKNISDDVVESINRSGAVALGLGIRKLMKK